MQIKQKTCSCDWEHRRVWLYKKSSPIRPSNWSTVICLNCGTIWKSQFKWVDLAKKITTEDKLMILKRFDIEL